MPLLIKTLGHWVPAFAGMTGKKTGLETFGIERQWDTCLVPSPMTVMHDTSNACTSQPIAFARSPYARRIDAPHQPTVTEGTETGALSEATIEFVADFPAAAFRDLAGFERIWVIFMFHRSEGWKAEVKPPEAAANAACWRRVRRIGPMRSDFPRSS